MKLKLFSDRLNYMTMTFTYLIWQSLVTSIQTSYFTALFVSMVFSDEDKNLIKKNISVEGT